jgi:hypothetical protein
VVPRPVPLLQGAVPSAQAVLLMERARMLAVAARALRLKNLVTFNLPFSGHKAPLPKPRSFVGLA